MGFCSVGKLSARIELVRHRLAANIFPLQVISSLLRFPIQIVLHLSSIYSTYYYPGLLASLAAIPFLLYLLPRVSHAT